MRSSDPYRIHILGVIDVPIFVFLSEGSSFKICQRFNPTVFSDLWTSYMNYVLRQCYFKLLSILFCVPDILFKCFSSVRWILGELHPVASVIYLDCCLGIFCNIPVLLPEHIIIFGYSLACNDIIDAFSRHTHSHPLRILNFIVGCGFLSKNIVICSNNVVW